LISQTNQVSRMASSISLGIYNVQRLGIWLGSRDGADIQNSFETE